MGYYEFPTVKPDSGDVSHHPFVPEIAHFMECIENDVESHASIHDIRKTMALCFAIDESAAKGGQPVKVKLRLGPLTCRLCTIACRSSLRQARPGAHGLT